MASRHRDWDGSAGAGTGTGGHRHGGKEERKKKNAFARLAPIRWGRRLVDKLLRELVTVIVAALVVVFDAGSVKEKKEKKSLLVGMGVFAWIHGDWGGLVVDVGAELGAVIVGIVGDGAGGPSTLRGMGSTGHHRRRGCKKKNSLAERVGHVGVNTLGLGGLIVDVGAALGAGVGVLDAEAGGLREN